MAAAVGGGQLDWLQLRSQKRFSVELLCIQAPHKSVEILLMHVGCMNALPGGGLAAG